MSDKLLRGYRFGTEAQWNTCLFSCADRDSREARGGFRPFVPYAQPATRYETRGGYAPTTTCVGEVLWRDGDRYGDGNLQRLPYGDDKPHAVTAPFAIAHATRLVATSNALWVAGEAPESLQAFDPATLARQLVVEIPRARVLDIAGDGHEGIFALLERHGVLEIAHYDCAGQQVKPAFAVEGVPEPAEFVYLRSVDQLVVLDRAHSKLHWFGPAGGTARFAVAVTMLRPCFAVSALGSDGRGRLFIAGTDGKEFGGRPHVIALDAEGNLLGDMEIEESATGVTGNRANMLVTTPRGLLRFDMAVTVPRESPEVRCVLITPMLEAPATEDLRRWLRVEATASLPAGSALEISYVATDDREVRDLALRLTESKSIPAGRRLQQLHNHLGNWRTFSFYGADTARADETVPLAAPLFDVREQYLWVSITLIASPGGGIPSLSKLAILYPGHTLMENLPAVYQRAEAQPGSFLRALVGVVESTTQTLDARIGTMGSLVHPKTAPGPWLDFVARWLGLPWDDALSVDQKRRILSRAAEIANRRGTRAGLEALLDSLIPGRPRRFRVVDSTVDFGLATAGGDTCLGSRLPVMLGGLPSTATELGSKAILGYARLPCPDSEGDASRLVGRVRVDVSANAEEQTKWQPWLRSLIEEMVPATVRVQVRWLSAAAFRQDVQLDEALTLDTAPTPHLGTDAVTGIARLPGQRGISLAGPGADSDIPLH